MCSPFYCVYFDVLVGKLDLSCQNETSFQVLFLEIQQNKIFEIFLFARHSSQSEGKRHERERNFKAPNPHFNL